MTGGWRAAMVAAAVLVAAAGGCQTAPVTGRDQLILVPDAEMAKIGSDTYRKIRAEKPITRDPKYAQAVERVGRRIAAVSAHPEWSWQFTVFEDPTPNAFALPGGKVGVNTGLFKVARNDAQLAAVLGHEVAHAVARHGAERMSQHMIVHGGLQGLGAALGSGGGNNAGVVQAAAAAATLGVILPFSRDQEAEADQIGLLYMAKAGYDPREAIALWRNFEALGGGRPPEFLSTHPSEGTRIRRLEAFMPQAMAAYQTARDKPAAGR